MYRTTRLISALVSRFIPDDLLRNVGWNGLGGAWVGLMVLACTPYFVSRLSIEGYGVLGVWLMLQALMGLLDMGLGAALLREFARGDAESVDRPSKADMLRTLEVIYWVLSSLVLATLIALTTIINGPWLQTDKSPEEGLVTAYRAMAIALALQFPSSLYLSGLTGLQQHRSMNILHITGTTLRYGVGVAVLSLFPSLTAFFLAQVIVSGVNTFLVRRALFRQVRPFPVIRLSFRADYLRTIWRFSVGMSATSIVALLMANADRAALTFYSSSSDIGRYSIAFAATGVLQMGIQPIYRTFFPRYAELVGRGEVMHLREEYYRSCRLLAVILIPIGTVTWLFAPELFRLWLGFDDATISTIFRYLLLGIVCAGMTWLPAAFQQAHGWTRLHALTIALPLFLGLPIMIYLIDKKGAVGATFLWVAHGVSAITVGLWFMHRRLLCGEFLLWYRKVVTPPAIAALSVAGISATIMPHGIQSFAAGIWVAVTGLLALLTSVWASDRFGRGDHAAPIKKM